MTTKTNETKTETKVLSKQEQMAAFTAAFSKPKLTRIDGIADMNLYVKRMSVREVNDLERIGEEIAKQKNDDGLDKERKLCLELFDEDGDLFFDRDSATDLQFLNNMPFAARELIANETHLANRGAGALKND